MTTPVTTKKILKGTVVSDVMDKTVVVVVKRYVKDTKYHKYSTRSKKYKAHDPENRFHVGDEVEIIETRPISKDKHFHVVYTA
jgi:small subunit ribosomal protein S17